MLSKPCLESAELLQDKGQHDNIQRQNRTAQVAFLVQLLYQVRSSSFACALTVSRVLWVLLPWPKAALPCNWLRSVLCVYLRETSVACMCLCLPLTFSYDGLNDADCGASRPRVFEATVVMPVSGAPLRELQLRMLRMCVFASRNFEMLGLWPRRFAALMTSCTGMYSTSSRARAFALQDTCSNRDYCTCGTDVEDMRGELMFYCGRPGCDNTCCLECWCGCSSWNQGDGWNPCWQLTCPGCFTHNLYCEVCGEKLCGACNSTYNGSCEVCNELD